MQMNKLILLYLKEGSFIIGIFLADDTKLRISFESHVSGQHHQGLGIILHINRQRVEIYSSNSTSEFLGVQRVVVFVMR